MTGYNEYQNITPLPRRRAYFIFGDEDEGADKFLIEGLNIKFDVLYNTGGMFPEAHFGICNLNSDHLNFLTNFFAYGNPRRRNRTVKFFAGYDDAKNPKKLKDIPLLYSGSVMLTSITFPPDIWLNFDTLATGNIHRAEVQFSLRGNNTIRDIAEAAAKHYGLGLEWRALSPGKNAISNFSCDGTGYDFAIKLHDADPNLQFSSDGITLRITDTTPDVNNLTMPRWKVDRDHAMIGEPRFSYIGASVDTLLNPLIRPGDFVELKSKFQPAGNGEYFIRTVRHHGELRGNGFNTTLDLMRPADDPEDIEQGDPVELEQ